MRFIPRSKYIGTASQTTIVTYKDNRIGKEVHSWVLSSHPWFGRMAKYIGPDMYWSEAAQSTRLAVEAWKRGGPLPNLDDDTRPSRPAKVFSFIHGGKE